MHPILTLTSRRGDTEALYPGEGKSLFVGAALIGAALIHSAPHSDPAISPQALIGAAHLLGPGRALLRAAHATCLSLPPDTESDARIRSAFAALFEQAGSQDSLECYLESDTFIPSLLAEPTETHANPKMTELFQAVYERCGSLDRAGIALSALGIVSAFLRRKPEGETF